CDLWLPLLWVLTLGIWLVSIQARCEPGPIKMFAEIKQWMCPEKCRQKVNPAGLTETGTQKFLPR
ncbi:MAG: hypothetical protein WAN07_03955, partial [Candidatus Binatus sp.]